MKAKHIESRTAGGPHRLASAKRRGSRRWMAAAFVAALLMLAPALSGCSTPDGGGGGPRDAPPAEPLYPGEVRDYQGKNLSSIEDFRENSIEGPQEVDIDTYRLRIHGRVESPLDLTYDEVLARQPYSKVVRLDCVEGWGVDIWWEGVLLSDLLEQAGADMTSALVIFRAVDGYSSSLPLNYIRDNEILLASKMNGIVLPPERGYPFQVVAEDRWGYKWVKWVKDIEVSNDAAFKGYWESRGYSNTGRRDESSRD